MIKCHESLQRTVRDIRVHTQHKDAQTDDPGYLIVLFIPLHAQHKLIIRHS
jgi:hypothetical protein